jgi:hypothetical protein
MLILSLLFGAFRPPMPEYRVLPAIVRMRLSFFSRRQPLSCFSRAMAAENVDVAAGHSKMLPVLVPGPGERPWRVRPVGASVFERVRTASTR